MPGLTPQVGSTRLENLMIMRTSAGPRSAAIHLLRKKMTPAEDWFNLRAELAERFRLRLAPDHEECSTKTATVASGLIRAGTITQAACALRFGTSNLPNEPERRQTRIIWSNEPRRRCGYRAIFAERTRGGCARPKLDLSPDEPEPVRMNAALILARLWHSTLAGRIVVDLLLFAMRS